VERGQQSGQKSGIRSGRLSGPDPSRLTPRQLEVLRLIGQGLTDAQIADALFVSRRTVNAHVRDIFRTLEVSRRSAATRYALLHGLT
jgi:DNA-binding NarL/FixJ family response regulator